jgi:hypothetical protein
MAATSFDRTVAWLGPRKWRLLHLLGGWYIWISFAVAVGKRVPIDRFYWPMAALVLAAGRAGPRRRDRAPGRDVAANPAARRIGLMI